MEDHGLLAELNGGRRSSMQRAELGVGSWRSEASARSSMQRRARAQKLGAGADEGATMAAVFLTAVEEGVPARRSRQVASTHAEDIKEELDAGAN